jgi:class 3 adenylate cyclase
LGEPLPADRSEQRTTPRPATVPSSDEDEVLPAVGNDVEQPVARAEHEADGDSVELASYVPALVVRRFADRHEPLGEAESERFVAAVLFADISGFTRATASTSPLKTTDHGHGRVVRPFLGALP